VGVAHDHSNGAACKQCGRTNHNTIDCKFLGQEKCAKCRLFGHGSAECRRDKKSGAKSSAPPTKKRKLGQANQVEGRNPQDDEESDEGAVAFNLESYDACNSYAMDERVIYYDWLADSASTTHITNQRDAFINYRPLQNAVVQGVGDLTT
jgi:hypothetical protein